MKDAWFYKFARLPLVAVFTAIFFPRVEGKENIPADGKVILAGNHTHVLDCVLVAKATKRVVRFMAKAELMEGFGKGFFKSVGIIPVNREQSGKSAVVGAENALNDEQVLGIFPEGTVNRTSEPIMPFKAGAVKIAYDTDAPIVPFAITGKYKPFRRSVKIKFFPPIKIEGGLKKTNNRIMEMVINEIKGQENNE